MSVSSGSARVRTLQCHCQAIPQHLGAPLLEPVRLSGHEALDELFAYELCLKTPDGLNPVAARDAATQLDLDAFIGQEIDVPSFNITRWLTLAVLAASLSACAAGGASSPAPAAPPPQAKSAAVPQVIYRIDDHRHFELTPGERCTGNPIYFVDTAKGIHSEVMGFSADMNQTTLIIDAANDQYLVGPVWSGGGSCMSCGGAYMPYSTDGGRTWQRVWSPGTTNDLMVSGSRAYQSFQLQRAHTYGLDLTLSQPKSDDWKSVRDFTFKPRVASMDTQVICKASGIGSLK